MPIKEETIAEKLCNLILSLSMYPEITEVQSDTW